MHRWAWLAAAALGAAALVVTAAPSGAAAPTVVSLTFDDGHIDQLLATELLDARGLDATFYVNSGRIGMANYVGAADLDQMAQAGHEIGGHTVSHARLGTLSDDEQRREICNDRTALLARGYQVRSFAYPFSSTNASTARIAAECGYNSARLVGGLVSPGTCYGCPVANTVPPPDPFRVRSPDSVKQSTTFDVLQEYVTQARATPGGWVPIVFHHVCSPCEDELGVDTAVLTQFLDWLAAQPADAVVVRTVGDVIGGAVQPGVPGPSPPPPDGGNLVRNPSLESDTDADGTADCWQHGGFGANTGAWARVGDAHDGAVAEQVTVSNYGGGDRSLIVRLDQGTCAIAAVAGRTYEVGAWYRATGRVRFKGYARNAAGGWEYWTQSPVLEPASAWTAGAWTTPEVPAGATAISIGLSITSNGTLAADDLAVTEVEQEEPPVPLLPNPGLETDANGDGVGDCWQRGGSGTNAFAWSRTSEAHSGSWAERVTITSRSTGDRKLVVSQREPGCAPAANAGTAYRTSGWYTSTAPVKISVFVRDGSGTWRYWASSGWFPASGMWSEAVWTTPAAPDGTTAISFGLALPSTGTLTVDDLALAAV